MLSVMLLQSLTHFLKRWKILNKNKVKKTADFINIGKKHEKQK